MLLRCRINFLSVVLIAENNGISCTQQPVSHLARVARTASNIIIILSLYTALFSALEKTHCAIFACGSELSK